MPNLRANSCFESRIPFRNLGSGCATAHRSNGRSDRRTAQSSIVGDAGHRTQNEMGEGGTLEPYVGCSVRSLHYFHDFLNDVFQPVFRLNCQSVGQSYRIVAYFSEAYSVPHWEYHSFAADLAACQAVQFLLRPVLLEEVGTEITTPKRDRPSPRSMDWRRLSPNRSEKSSYQTRKPLD